MWAEDVTDVLNQTLTEITGTSYSEFSGKTATSDAVYAGQCAGGNSSIQLRSNSNNSGVVTTASGGKVKSITVEWQSSTSNGRTLNVYGKNSAYSAATDLYNTSNQGTLLGTIVKGTSTSLTVSGDYEYIGFRSASGAMYLTSVTIVWEVEGSGDTRTATTVTIDDSGITNTNVFEGTAAGSFSATVMAGESAVSGASVTWESETPSVATIDAASGVVTLVAAGSTKITATYAGDTSYKNSSATYTLTVTNDDPNGPGTENNPYTVAQARAAIDAGTGVTGVYATGIVSEIVTAYNSTYGNITYNISADGTTTADQLQAYRGKSYNGDWFTSEDDIQVGDEVVIYGNLKKYNSTYEFDTNNQLVSLQRTELLDNVITVTGGTEFSMDPDNNNELTLVATATSGEAVTFTLDTETTLTVDDDFIFDADNGNLLVYNEYAGTIVIKANSAATETYKAAPEVTITINVSGQKAEPVFNLPSPALELTYGESYTFVNGTDYTTDGTLVLGVDNTDVIQIDGNTVTAVAVGPAHLSVSTTEGETYKASGDALNLSVIVNPTPGKTTAPSAASEVTFDFDGNAWELPTSTTSTAGDYTDGTYTISLAGSGYYCLNGSALLLGKTNATLTFPAFDKAVTQIDVVGTSGASAKVKQNIYVGDVAVSTETEGAKDVTNEYVIDESYQAAGNIYVLKVTSNHNTQISSIVVHFAGGGGSATESVTLNAYGYGTYASVNPLDFSGENNFTAWEVTNIDKGVVTFNQVTSTIKGGQGVLLKGEAGAVVEIPMADGDTELTDNLFVGIVNPTYVSHHAYFGLKGTSLTVLNDGVVPAGKAIIETGNVDLPEGVKNFTFVFNSTDGIQTIEKVSAEEAAKIFDLGGRRLTEMRRGVNIVNGKKIMVK